MPAYTLDLDTVDLGAQALVGGKAARLGELARSGFAVPPGFCVTVQAFDRFVTTVPSNAELLERLPGLDADDHDAIVALSAELRATLESASMPADIEVAIHGAVSRLGAERPCAVRSSATAEDLATASFAGQQDSYLNVVGHRDIVGHVKRCWASLFTDRAITYRLRHQFDHREIRMAVLVQAMVPAQAAGVLFTADPVSGNRRVATVEAVFGLGDALVSGRADADLYRVRDATVDIAALAAGRPVLSAADVLALVRLGRRIEAHFGHPQDIEWCLLDGDFQIVQSRPITTLFPVPEVNDGRMHVFVSVGHQQMMTDAMTPLGLSVWQLTTRRPMAEAGGRLFVDVTDALEVPASRAALVEGFLRSDPLTGGALQSIAERMGVVVGSQPAQLGVTEPPIVPDPATVARLIERSRASLTALERDIAPLSGPALIDFVMADFAELQRILFAPESTQVIMAGMDAAHWLNDHLRDWLGETNPADVLTQSVPHNVTSEMGLALLDVADAMRPHPDVVALLAGWRDTDGDLLAALGDMPGGQQARHALQDFLGRYGMRCTGEIDITRARWSEQPSALVPTILANIANFAPGEAQRRLETGRRQAESKRNDVLARLRALPDGAAKAAETESMIDRLRAFAGYREYPKYGMVCRYFVYKRALLGEARRLVEAGVLRAPDDAYYLRLQELHEVCRTHRVDERLIEQRKAELRSYQQLRPPRVLTSEGEVITGAYRRSGLPFGALPGVAVSAGTVEGCARVVTDFASARLAAGDILVTAYTDPSWTPLFVGISGLVTEVGGLMTHGAVIAREYGLPAVVGVEGATTRILDGQRIRVDGTAGYVEVLA